MVLRDSELVGFGAVGGARTAGGLELPLCISSVLCDGLLGWDEGGGWQGGSEVGGRCVFIADSCCCSAETNNIVKQFFKLKK